MGCCMSVLTGANGWTSVAPQIDKTPSANTGENVEDLENALDTLRTENEALKREITNCINVLCVMDNFLQCNNITVEELIHSSHKAESSSAALRDSPTQEAFSVRDSIRADQSRHEAELLGDILKKVCTMEFSSLTLEERLKLDKFFTKQSENKDTKDKNSESQFIVVGITANACSRLYPFIRNTPLGVSIQTGRGRTPARRQVVEQDPTVARGGQRALFTVPLFSWKTTSNRRWRAANHVDPTASLCVSRRQFGSGKHASSMSILVKPINVALGKFSRNVYMNTRLQLSQQR